MTDLITSNRPFVRGSGYALLVILTVVTIKKSIKLTMSEASEDAPIYGPFFGVMGASAAIIFSCKYIINWIYVSCD